MKTKTLRVTVTISTIEDYEVVKEKTYIFYNPTRINLERSYSDFTLLNTDINRITIDGYDVREMNWEK